MIKTVNKITKFEFQDQIKKNYPLCKNSWFGVGGNASTFFSPRNRIDLKTFLKNFKHKKIITIGSGSNILFKDTGFKGLVIKLGKEFSKIEDSNSSIVAGAAALKSNVSDFAKKKGIGEFEFLSAIPGNIGGGIIMNSGCFGSEISDIVEQITIMDYSGNEKILNRNKINFQYRESGLPENYIVLEVLFRKTKRMPISAIEEKIKKIKSEKKINQPTGIRTGGSTFKNPVNNKKAWELIKQCGCDKISFGNAKFSQHHCNFIDNTDLASSKDIQKLIKETQKIVHKKSGIKLELEIKIA
jgi:UDP-N-acetylmuramate dehydrogenase